LGSAWTSRFFCGNLGFLKPKMKAPGPLAQIIRFGLFQLDPKAGELRKEGVKVKLQDQPFRVLALLVERAGQVVTREELRQRVWPTDVYVAFDQGLNNAIKKVRDALGDSADNPRFIETVAKHGYRFLAPVSPVQTLSTALPSRLAFFTARNTALMALGAVCLLAPLAYWALHRPAVHAKPSSEKVILAVLPFDNLSHDPNQEFFSDGLTEEMITQLSNVNPGQLGVIARGSVVRYKGSSLPANQIGKELHADYLVQGSVRREAGRVRIAVQLIQVRDDTDLWAESYDRELKDILALQDSVARTVAKQIHVALAPQQRTSPRKVDPEVYEASLKGRYYWNKRTADGISKAALYFEQAVNKDPTNGAAYSGLADCNSGLAWHGFMSPAEVLPKAYAAAQKAVEIDPQSAEAHASLALVLDHKWDWAGAQVEFKRALELNPQYANAHHWYGDYLSIQGRHDEALLEARRALELDPTNLMIGTWVGLRYYLEGRYDSASELGRDTVDLDSSFAAAHLILGESYAQQGRYKQGLDELQKAASLSGSPLYIAQVGVGRGLAGDKKEALRIIRELHQISSKRYVSPYGIAQIYAALNDKEQTYEWLEIAYRDRAVWMSYLAVDPVFASIRSEEHFRDLLRRVGLPA